jgi:hypothetical protein
MIHVTSFLFTQGRGACSAAAIPTTHRNWNSSIFNQAAALVNCLHGIIKYPSIRLRHYW